VLDQRAHVDQLLLLGAGQALRRKLGVRDEHFLQAHVLGGSDQREDLAPAEMAGGENHVVLRDALQATTRAGDEVPRFIDHRQRRRRNAFRRELALNGCPEREFFAAAVEMTGRLVRRVDRRHPHNLAARPPRQLDGHRIQSADTMVERDRAEHLAARHGFRHYLRPLAGLDVVGLQDEAFHPVLEEFPGAIDVVDAPRNHVGTDVYLQVVGVFERFPGGVGDLRRIVRHGPAILHPPSLARLIRASAWQARLRSPRDSRRGPARLIRKPSPI
jgi:hypothetical protein